LVNESEIRESKSYISIHSSNSYVDLDEMFIPEFFSLDKAVAESHKKKQENLGFLLDNMGNMLNL
jgi:hypothetical protein